VKIKAIFALFLFALWLVYIFPLKQYPSEGLISMLFKYGVALFYSIAGFVLFLFLLQRDFWIELWIFIKEKWIDILYAITIIAGVILFILDMC
jgi:hypothetical protein